MEERFPDLQGPERLKCLSKLNVIEQIAHLHTHPAVESRWTAGSLAIHGWYYEIHSGMIEVYDQECRMFRELD
jgi:carbonic anhydrase